MMKRITSQKKAIERVFLDVDGPLGVDEILRRGREMVTSLNLATVYRNLKLLVESGRIRQIAHPSFGVLYEPAGKGHHHFFHCRRCDRVFDIPGCALNEKEAAPEGFIVDDHEVFLSGTCPSCGSAHSVR